MTSSTSSRLDHSHEGRKSDPLTGYAALREAVGVVRRTDLGVFRLWGKDPLRMVNGLITNEVSPATSERAVYAAMLTPRGKMITDLRTFVRSSGESTEVIVVVPGVAVAEVTEHFRKYIPPLFARWSVASIAVLGVYGPKASSVVESLLDEAPVGPGASVHGVLDDREVTAVVSLRSGRFGYEIFVPADTESEILARALHSAGQFGGGECGLESFEIARIEEGLPRFGLDMTAESLPAEAFESTGLMDQAISFTKGCYTGQEVVIRIAHRGHVNRHLRGGRLGDEAPPELGTPLFGDSGKEVGRTTSAVSSPLLGQTIAMAVLRREVVPGQTVRLGSTEGAAGLVVDLPFSDTLP